MSSNEPALPEELIQLALALLEAARKAPIETVQALLDRGAPAWYQDVELGWSSLHYAAERRDPELLNVLVKGGAVWNAVDKWGRTAGEISLSLGDKNGWEVIRNEGLRSEMLHHILAGSSNEDAEGTLTLRAEDKTSAGDNLTFLQSELRWETGDDGKERVLDADGNGVMMGWEEPLMQEHVRLMTADHPDAQDGQAGMSILNVGFGLGIIDRIFQNPPSPHSKPLRHTIMEAHPQVLAHIRETGFDKIPGVTILEGRWQDWLLDAEKIGEVIGGTPDGMGFDAIFVDTFAEGYEDMSYILEDTLALSVKLKVGFGDYLKAFFEVLPDILEPENGVFSFWNGLGATNPTIYSVSSSLAELHLEDVGLDVIWHDVAIPESLREEVWQGVRRRYWELPGYRLPIAKMRAY